MSRVLGEAWAHLSHVPLRAEASDRSECVNEVLAGETVTELALGRGDWVQVRLPDGYEGWMDRRQLNPVTGLWKGTPIRLAAASAWHDVAGVGCLQAQSFVAPTANGCSANRPCAGGRSPSGLRRDHVDWCVTMLGVPYHWGGRCGWGLDCSGMTSLAAALTGKVMPRDASEQFKCGKEVALDQVRQDDVAFFANATGKITHVGVCDGDGQVIHASGEVRIDRLVGTQLQRHEDRAASHHLAGIKRWS